MRDILCCHPELQALQEFLVYKLLGYRKFCLSKQETGNSTLDLFHLSYKFRMTRRTLCFGQVQLGEASSVKSNSL